MADDGDLKVDVRINYFKERVNYGFPKFVGPKLEKLFTTEDVREIISTFCNDENQGCLVFPETLKVDLTLPSKLPKGKVLLFTKLKPCVLTLENIRANVSVNYLSILHLCSYSYIFYPYTHTHMIGYYNRARWSKSIRTPRITIK